MSTNVEPETDVRSIEYDSGLDTVVFTWNRYVTGERFRTALTDALAVIEREGATGFIADAREFTAHTDDQMEWLQREFTPRMIEAGVERSVQIHPESVIAEMEAEETAERADATLPEGVAFEITTSMDRAREFVRG